MLNVTEFAKAVESHDLRQVHAGILEIEAQTANKGEPLNVLSHVERAFRGRFLDDEEIARQQHSFLIGYYQKHPEIFTPNARKFLDFVSLTKGSRIYVVELNVPHVEEGPYKWVSDIDIVSYYPLPNTTNILNGLAAGVATITPFSEPKEKGNAHERYWSTHSLTEVRTPENLRITDIKARKRIHGTGYSISNPDVLPSHLKKAFRM